MKMQTWSTVWAAEQFFFTLICALLGHVLANMYGRLQAVRTQQQYTKVDTVGHTVQPISLHNLTFLHVLIVGSSHWIKFFSSYRLHIFCIMVSGQG